MRRLPVVIAPLINASYYPAFTDYTGSISLRLETARNLILDTCNSLSRHGLSRFYVLNTSLSTLRPLAEVARALDAAIRFGYMDLDAALQFLPVDLLQQQYGSHADEHETSLMLHIAPRVIDMDRAVDEGEGRLTRNSGQSTWSATGVYGQATLASEEKGRVIAEVLLTRCLEEIENLSNDRGMKQVLIVIDTILVESPNGRDEMFPPHFNLMALAVNSVIMLRINARLQKFPIFI